MNRALSSYSRSYYLRFFGASCPDFLALFCPPDNKGSSFKQQNQGGSKANKYTAGEIKLLEVGLSNKYFKRLLKTHYPQSKGIVGRRINFVIFKDNIPVGIIGFASPPIINKVFKHFNIQDLSIGERGKLILNNNIFRLEIKEKNLGTRVLKEARQKVKKLYKEKYGEDLLGLITFVEPPRTGAVYKADNWEYIGETEGYSIKRVAGFGKGDKRIVSEGNKKLIFAYKFKRGKNV